MIELLYREVFDIVLADWIGLLGVLLYTSSYAILQLGLIPGRGYVYAGMNGVAATCVAVSLVVSFNLSAILIQLFFLSMSVVGIARLLLASRPLALSGREVGAAAALLPGLPPRRAKVLLGAGDWHALPSGPLSAEGRALESLWYVDRGRVDVRVGGTVVRSVGAGSVIGDVSIRHGEEASATTCAVEPGRYWSIRATVLRRLLRGNEDISAAFERGMSEGVRSKLKALTTEATEAKSRSRAFDFRVCGQHHMPLARYRDTVAAAGPDPFVEDA